MSSEVLQIYAGPGRVYDLLGSLGKGVILVLVGVDAGLEWGLVDLGFGQEGWVSLGGLDWDGSPAQLPQIEAPPTPTPTITPVPPPTVTELRRFGAGYYLGLSGMEPGETVNIVVTYLGSGTVVANLAVTANDNGNIHSLFINVAGSTGVLKGDYRFFIYGERGWTLTVTKTVD